MIVLAFSKCKHINQSPIILMTNRLTRGHSPVCVMFNSYNRNTIYIVQGIARCHQWFWNSHPTVYDFCFQFMANSFGEYTFLWIPLRCTLSWILLSSHNPLQNPFVSISHLRLLISYVWWRLYFTICYRLSWLPTHYFSQHPQGWPLLMRLRHDEI